MVLTPTYHVFDLYKAHMDARQLDCFIEAEKTGTEKHSLPAVTASASEKNGTITLTLSNLDPDRKQEVEIVLRDEAVGGAKGRILSGAMDAYNDFENAPLFIREYTDFSIRDGRLTATLPPCAVAELTL